MKEDKIVVTSVVVFGSAKLRHTAKGIREKSKYGMMLLEVEVEVMEDVKYSV